MYIIPQHENNIVVCFHEYMANVLVMNASKQRGKLLLFDIFHVQP